MKQKRNKKLFKENYLILKKPIKHLVAIIKNILIYVKLKISLKKLQKKLTTPILMLKEKFLFILMF